MEEKYNVDVDCTISIWNHEGLSKIMVHSYTQKMKVIHILL